MKRALNIKFVFPFLFLLVGCSDLLGGEFQKPGQVSHSSNKIGYQFGFQNENWSITNTRPFVDNLPVGGYVESEPCRNMAFRDLFLLLDRSGSMLRRIEPGANIVFVEEPNGDLVALSTRFDAVKYSARLILEKAPSDRWKIGVGTFALNFSQGQDPILIRDSDGSREQMLNALQSLEIVRDRTANATLLDSGLWGSAAHLRGDQRERKQVIVYTDGRFCNMFDSYPSCAEIRGVRQQLEEWGIFVTLVGYSDFRQEMDMVASRNPDGSPSVYYVDEDLDYIDALDGAFEEIVHDLCDTPLKVTIHENETEFHGQSTSNMWEVTVKDGYLENPAAFQLNAFVEGDDPLNPVNVGIEGGRWIWGGQWREDKDKINIEFPIGQDVNDVTIRVQVTNYEQGRAHVMTEDTIVVSTPE